MDATAALAELVALSTQVVEVVTATPDGEVEAARTASDERAGALAVAGRELLVAAGAMRPGVQGVHPVERVHVDLERGSLVVCSDGERSIVATTVAEPTAGLVAYDLRVVLRRMRGEAA